MKLRSIIHDITAFLQYGDLPTSYYVKRGMKVGKNFSRQSGSKMDPENCWLIEIGDDVRMSNKVQLLAHDFSSMHHTGYVKFGRIIIGDRTWIGANSTILMNVRIGNDVIIGAGSLVNKDIPDGMVAAGVPAKVICTTEEYRLKQLKMIAECPNYVKADLNYGGKMTKEKQQKILKAMDENPHRMFYAKFRPYFKQIRSGKHVKIN